MKHYQCHVIICSRGYSESYQRKHDLRAAGPPAAAQGSAQPPAQGAAPAAPVAAPAAQGAVPAAQGAVPAAQPAAGYPCFPGGPGGQRAAGHPGFGGQCCYTQCATGGSSAAQGAGVSDIGGTGSGTAPTKAPPPGPVPPPQATAPMPGFCRWCGVNGAARLCSWDCCGRCCRWMRYRAGGGTCPYHVD